MKLKNKKNRVENERKLMTASGDSAAVVSACMDQWRCPHFHFRTRAAAAADRKTAELLLLKQSCSVI